eukprot:6024635-Prymnesium_polylepis.1
MGLLRELRKVAEHRLSSGQSAAGSLHLPGEAETAAFSCNASLRVGPAFAQDNPDVERSWCEVPQELSDEAIDEQLGIEPPPPPPLPPPKPLKPKRPRNGKRKAAELLIQLHAPDPDPPAPAIGHI